MCFALVVRHMYWEDNRPSPLIAFPVQEPLPASAGLDESILMFMFILPFARPSVLFSISLLERPVPPQTSVLASSRLRLFRILPTENQCGTNRPSYPVILPPAIIKSFGSSLNNKAVIKLFPKCALLEF